MHLCQIDPIMGQTCREFPNIWHSYCSFIYEMEHRGAKCPELKYRPPVSLGKGRSNERPSILNQYRKTIESLFTLPEVCQYEHLDFETYLADLREGKEVICRLGDIRAYDCAKMSQHSEPPGHSAQEHSGAT